jgi:mRNA-degrading endonuclease toxin of MazEF toxin-antitoxin module
MDVSGERTECDGTLDRSRLKARLGRAPDPVLASIGRALAATLDLTAGK